MLNPKKAMLNRDIRARIADGNAEAVGAASLLLAIMIVGGFLFYSLKVSDAEGLRTGSRLADGYGLSQPR